MLNLKQQPRVRAVSRGMSKIAILMSTETIFLQCFFSPILFIRIRTKRAEERLDVHLDKCSPFIARDIDKPDRITGMGSRDSV